MVRSTRAGGTPERLAAEARRETLLDVARALFSEGGPGNVTMGTVAERGEVTRALVYKHFANRDDILAALYRREAATLDREFRREVSGAPEGLEPKVRAFIHAALAVADTHADFFAPLRPFGQTAEHRREQRTWDRRTASYYADLAAAELGLDHDVARLAVSALLAGVSSQVAQARGPRSAERKGQLEDLYVRMVMAALAGLAEG